MGFRSEFSLEQSICKALSKAIDYTRKAVKTEKAPPRQHALENTFWRCLGLRWSGLGLSQNTPDLNDEKGTKN